MTDDDIARVLGGIDGPRPLPDDLRESLVAGLDVAGRVDRAADSRPLPSDLRDRLVAATAAAHLPDDLRGQLLARFSRRRIASLTLTRVAAIAVAVLLVGGGLAAAALRGGDGDGDDDRSTLAGPATTTSTTTVTTVPVAPGETPATTTPVPTTTPPKPAATDQKPPSKDALLALSSCDDLLRHYKAAALARVGPYGIEGTNIGDGGRFGGGMPVAATAGSSAEGDSSGAPSAAESIQEIPDYSGTNNQEDAVDEPDRVKTDGKRLFAYVATESKRKLQSVRIDADGPHLVASTDVPWGDFELLLSGNRLVLVGRDFGHPMSITNPDEYQTSWTSVITYDVTDIAHPVLLHARFFEGQYVTARMTNGLVRVVVHSWVVKPDFVYPKDGSDAEKQRAAAANREAIERSTIGDWVPRMVSEHHRGAMRARTSKLCACEDTLRPQYFADFGTASVITVDPQDVEYASVASVQGGAGTVYASAAGLYVTTAPWLWDNPAILREQSYATAVHRFSIEGRAPAAYVASGAVPGTVPTQFAMSEYEGHLRIATESFNDSGSVSSVSVMKQVGNALVVVGQVGGLGPGEGILGVRFFGPKGYVVTFRQTDPLYVLDLSSPTQPKLMGELKITGYSAYLHRVDDGHLLGIGQEATEQGRRQGAQVQLFDVTDPASPKRTHQQLLGSGSSSGVEFDHHAFLYWPKTGTTVVPVRTAEGFRAAVFLAGPNRLDAQGQLSHEQHLGTGRQAEIVRSVVVGGSLYTISLGGLMANDLGSLQETRWLAF